MATIDPRIFYFRFFYFLNKFISNQIRMVMKNAAIGINDITTSLACTNSSDSSKKQSIENSYA